MSMVSDTFLAHLSITCSRGAFRVVMCLLSVVNNFFKTSSPKPLGQFGPNLAGMFLFKNCSQNLIPSKTLVAMATKLNFLSRNRWSDFKIISQERSMGDPFQKLFAKF